MKKKKKFDFASCHLAKTFSATLLIIY